MIVWRYLTIFGSAKEIKKCHPELLADSRRLIGTAEVTQKSLKWTMFLFNDMIEVSAKTSNLEVGLAKQLMDNNG